jgi:hypothetical protein
MSKENKDAEGTENTQDTEAVEETIQKKPEAVAVSDTDGISLRLAKAERKIKILTVSSVLVLIAILVIVVAGFCLRGFRDDDKGGERGPGMRGNGEMMILRDGSQQRPGFERNQRGDIDSERFDNGQETVTTPSN